MAPAARAISSPTAPPSRSIIRLFQNFSTSGGAGSGGGLGAGGAIFIDTGGTVVLNNTSFSHNSVIGGLGGTNSPYGGTLNGISSIPGAPNLPNGANGNNGTLKNDNSILFGDGKGNGVSCAAGTACAATNGGNATNGLRRHRRRRRPRHQWLEHRSDRRDQRGDRFYQSRRRLRKDNCRRRQRDSLDPRCCCGCLDRSRSFCKSAGRNRSHLQRWKGHARDNRYRGRCTQSRGRRHYVEPQRAEIGCLEQSGVRGPCRKWWQWGHRRRRWQGVDRVWWWCGRSGRRVWYDPLEQRYLRRRHRWQWWRRRCGRFWRRRRCRRLWLWCRPKRQWLQRCHQHFRCRWRRWRGRLRRRRRQQGWRDRRQQCQRRRRRRRLWRVHLPQHRRQR